MSKETDVSVDMTTVLCAQLVFYLYEVQHCALLNASCKGALSVINSCQEVTNFLIPNRKLYRYCNVRRSYHRRNSNENH